MINKEHERVEQLNRATRSGVWLGLKFGVAIGFFLTLFAVSAGWIS